MTITSTEMIYGLAVLAVFAGLVLAMHAILVAIRFWRAGR